VVRRSAQVARLAHLTHPAAVAVRDTLIAAVNRAGPRLVLRGADGIADWRPPTGPYAGPSQTAPPTGDNAWQPAARPSEPE
jgi:hypothetical protein